MCGRFITQEGSFAFPGSILSVVTSTGSTKMRWGWDLPWSSKKLLFNIRQETIIEKFNHFFQNNRCLVPFISFWEGKREFVSSGPSLYFTAIYDQDSFSIITTSPNTLIKPFHHRMPSIITAELQSIWLDPNAKTNTLLPLLQPFSVHCLSLVMS